MSLILISILVILILIILAKLFVNPNETVDTEHFNWDRYPGKDSVGYYNIPADNNRWDTLWKGSTSLDCYKESQRDCMKYSNCGICYKNGNAQCIPGDDQGPLFDDQCENWSFVDYYDNYIFGEKVTKTVPPWSRFAPDYEIWYPSPRARATLESFKEQSKVPNDII